LARSEAKGAGGSCGPTWATRDGAALPMTGLYSAPRCGKIFAKCQLDWHSTF
jgi:hypothetical protein